MAEPHSDMSTPALIKRATEQISTLVRDEFALARTEVTAKARHAGKGAGMFGGAGLVALYALAALLFGIGLLLDKVLPGWAAALVVAGLLFAISGLLALAGRGQVRSAVPPVPAEAIHDVRTDAGTLSSAVSHRYLPAPPQERDRSHRSPAERGGHGRARGRTAQQSDEEFRVRPARPPAEGRAGA